MLKRIKIKNFRNLEDVEINPAKITLLIGPNGTGKSGMFHSLCVLKQTFEKNSMPTNLSMVGNQVNLGSREQVISKHDVKQNMEISISFDFIAGDSAGNDNGDVEFTLVDTPNDRKKKIKTKLGKLEGEINFDAISGTDIVFKNDSSEELYHVDNSEGFGVNGSFASDALTSRSHYFDTRIIEAFLQKLQYVPVQRGTSQFKTHISSHKPQEIVNSQGNARLTQDILETIHYDHTLADLISKYTMKLFNKNVRPALIQSGLGDSLEDTADGTMGTSEFYDENGSAFAANTGFGLNQMSFLLVPLLASGNGSTIMIEEPEISLHPIAQKNLMDIFVDIVNAQDKQILLTTHSEHLAIALFHALESGRIGKDDVAIYSFDQGSHAKITKIDSPEGAFVKFLGEEKDLIQRYIEILGKKDQWLTKGSIEN